MNRKLVFLVMMVLLVFSLAACGGQSDSVKRVLVNTPYGENGELLVFNHDVTNQYLREQLVDTEALNYWTVTTNGVSTLSDYSGVLPSNVVTNADGVRTYTFASQDVLASFQIYVKPETIVGNSDDVVMVGFKFNGSNIVNKIGQTFNPNGMEVYVVFRDGNVTVIKGEDVAANSFASFDTGGFDPLGDDGYKDKVSYTVIFSYLDFDQEFEVYVAGGERPISTSDANFFDWILVIPVAFVMNFFASLLGNSFALGILFTTIVVRTIAWPIYAKSNDMSIKMNVAQPDMQRVQAKYATKKDPQSQQQMQMEMMQVYKKHGINVLGCLFPFLQMPIFIAMFRVVSRITIEGGMYAEGVANTYFLGINLSNQQDGIIGGFLAALVGASMFLLQKIAMKKPAYVKNTAKHNPTPQAEQTEKTMKFVSYFMVIMMAFASFQSNALALYWIFGNIYSLGQTLVNRKVNEKKHEQLKQKQLMG